MANERTPGKRAGGRTREARLGQALVFSAVSLPLFMVAVPVGMVNLSGLLSSPPCRPRVEVEPMPDRTELFPGGTAFTFRPAEPSAGPLALHAVRLERISLGRGARTWGQVTFNPPGLSLPYGGVVLQARSQLPDYGFDLPVARPERGLATLALGCHQVRGAHVVEWELTLTDRSGRRSGPVSVPIECTGEVLDDPPLLESVEIAASELGAAQRAAGLARFKGAHYPLRLTALSASPGYGFRSRYVYEDGAEQAFELGCHPNRPPHTVVWRFAAEDGRGRHGNVIEHTVHCR